MSDSTKKDTSKGEKETKKPRQHRPIYVRGDDGNEIDEKTLTEADWANIDYTYKEMKEKHLFHLYAGNDELYVGSMVRKDNSDRLVDVKDHLHELTIDDKVVLFNVRVYSDDEPTEKEKKKVSWKGGKYDKYLHVFAILYNTKISYSISLSLLLINKDKKGCDAALDCTCTSAAKGGSASKESPKNLKDYFTPPKKQGQKKGGTSDDEEELFDEGDAESDDGKEKNDRDWGENNGVCRYCNRDPCVWYEGLSDYMDSLYQGNIWKRPGIPFPPKIEDIGNDTYRFASYGHWYDHLNGKDYFPENGKTRQKIPNCVTRRIRKRYPDPNGKYVGFKPNKYYYQNLMKKDGNK